MQIAVILAGGKGTRLAERLNGLPKPLISVDGIPLLQRQIQSLKSYGFDHICVLVNHKAEYIVDFCKKHNNFDITLTIINDGEPRGTGGATLAALPQFPKGAEDILIIYGDTLFNIDFHRLLEFHKKHSGAGTIFLHPNDHPHDSDLIEIDTLQRVQKIHPYPHPQDIELSNLVNAACYVIRKQYLMRWRFLIEAKPPFILDFAKHLFPMMIEGGGTFYGYSSPEYIKDIGTPERLDRASTDIASGRFDAGTLQKKQRGVFLDRDGVINKEVGFLSRREQMELLPGVAKAIRQLNQSGILCVVVTNQPVIARGECTEEELGSIHARMDSLLGKEGAYIDRLYYCPHHPDKGFAGERPELKISCQCRKPNTGMLEQACKDLNIDRTQSWLVGDQTGDILAAQRMGIHSILVQTGKAGTDAKYSVSPDYQAKDLLDAVDIILHQHK